MRLAPGEERSDLASLDPGFRACLEALLGELRTRGWRPVLRATWRDDARQRLYYQLGGSQRKTGSLHQGQGPEGQPAALAADVGELWPLFHFSRHAAFYLDLRELASAQGLESGGSWSRTDPRWARYDLGWDPAHVQAKDARCGGSGR